MNRKAILTISLSILLSFRFGACSSQVSRYVVEWNGTAIVFTSASGLDQQMQSSTYRVSPSRVISPSGTSQTSTAKSLTLKSGTCKSGNGLYSWFIASGSANLEKRDLTVRILDSAGHTVRSFKLIGAIPIKYSGPTLNAKGTTEVSMEEIVLTYEKWEP